MKKALKTTALSVLFLGLTVSVMLAQTTNMTIRDDKGNLTTGTIMEDGRLRFMDTHGNLAYGTIKDGNVSISDSSGNHVFGTVRNGSVFPIDNKGLTTGTVRNGYVILSNSDGSTTTGTYDGTHMRTTTTGIPVQQPDNSAAIAAAQQQNAANAELQRERMQQSYEAGQAFGSAIGGVIYQVKLRHAIDKACWDGGWQRYYLQNGGVVNCTNWKLAHPKKDIKMNATVRGPNAFIFDPFAASPDIMQALDDKERVRVLRRTTICDFSFNTNPCPKNGLENTYFVETSDGKQGHASIDSLMLDSGVHCDGLRCSK